MSKEYLDRKEVELKVRTVINLWEEQPLIDDDQIEELVDLYYEICQLIPEEGVVMAEGRIQFATEDFQLVDNKGYTIFYLPTIDKKYLGKKVQIIIREVKK